MMQQAENVKIGRALVEAEIRLTVVRELRYEVLLAWREAKQTYEALQTHEAWLRMTNAAVDYTKAGWACDAAWKVYCKARKFV